MRRIPVFFSHRTVGGVLGFWMLLAVAFFGPPSTAQESSSVERALENLSDALQRDTSLDAATRKALSDLVDALKAERATEPATPPSGAPEVTAEDVAPAVDQYLESRAPDEDGGRLSGLKDRLKFSGDFRLRHESSINRDTRRDRHRERITFSRMGKPFNLGVFRKDDAHDAK